MSKRSNIALPREHSSVYIINMTELILGGDYIFKSNDRQKQKIQIRVLYYSDYNYRTIYTPYQLVSNSSVPRGTTTTKSVAEVQIAKYCSKRLSKEGKALFQRGWRRSPNRSDMVAISLQMHSIKDKENIICYCGQITAEENKVYCSVQKPPVSFDCW